MRIWAGRNHAVIRGYLIKLTGLRLALITFDPVEALRYK